MNASNVIDISTSRYCVTDDEAEENEGYEARVNNQPLKDDASNAWKRGWHEANEEWTGRELINIERESGI